MIGVFCKSYSNFTVALRGPADGSPADGRPADGRGSRKADVREMAERGVLSETAEGSETAERSSDAGGGMLGKFAVTGVDSDKTGLVDMMATGSEVLLRERQVSSQVNDSMRCSPVDLQEVGGGQASLGGWRSAGEVQEGGQMDI